MHMVKVRMCVFTECDLWTKCMNTKRLLRSCSLTRIASTAEKMPDANGDRLTVIVHILVSEDLQAGTRRSRRNLWPLLSSGLW
jgi:hypothetical protein